MNTLLYISLIACVCLAYYATALPQPAEEVESNDAKLYAEVESPAVVPAEDRYKRSPNGGYGGGRRGGYGGRRGGYGGGRGGHWGR